LFGVALQKLNLVNGVLFTGGWAKTGLYFDTAKAIFKVGNFFKQTFHTKIDFNKKIISIKKIVLQDDASHVCNMFRIHQKE
jgi:hypothetical protein